MDYIKASFQSLRGQWGAALEIAFLPRVLQGILGVVEWSFFFFGLYNLQAKGSDSGTGLLLSLAAGLALWVLWQMLWIPYRLGVIRQYDGLLQEKPLSLRESFLFFGTWRTWIRSMRLGLWLGLRQIGPFCLAMVVPASMIVLPWYLYTYYGWQILSGLYVVIYMILIICWAGLGALYAALVCAGDFLGETFFCRSKSIGIYGCTKRSNRKMRGTLWKLLLLKLLLSLRHSPWFVGFGMAFSAPFFGEQDVLAMWTAFGFCLGGLFISILTEPVYWCAMSHFADKVLKDAQARQMTMEYVVTPWGTFDGAAQETMAITQEEQSSTMAFKPRLFPTGKP